MFARRTPATATIVTAGGQVVVPPFDIQIGRCAVVEDPWGNRLVLLDNSKGALLTDRDGTVVGTAEPEPGADWPPKPRGQWPTSGLLDFPLPPPTLRWAGIRRRAQGTHSPRFD